MARKNQNQNWTKQDLLTAFENCKRVIFAELDAKGMRDGSSSRGKNELDEISSKIQATAAQIKQHEEEAAVLKQRMAEQRLIINRRALRDAAMRILLEGAKIRDEKVEARQQFDEKVAKRRKLYNTVPSPKASASVKFNTTMLGDNELKPIFVPLAVVKSQNQNLEYVFVFLREQQFDMSRIKATFIPKHGPLGTAILYELRLEYDNSPITVSDEEFNQALAKFRTAQIDVVKRYLLDNGLSSVTVGTFT